MFYNRPRDFAAAVVASLVSVTSTRLRFMDPIGTLLALCKVMAKE